MTKPSNEIEQLNGGTVTADEHRFGIVRWPLRRMFLCVTIASICGWSTILAVARQFL